MAKIKKRKLKWNYTYNPDVSGYKLYWAVDDGEVDYDSDYADIGNVSEVILPDGVSSFPLVAGDVKLGVTALNHAGNESDMSKLTASFDFTVPDAPMEFDVEET